MSPAEDVLTAPEITVSLRNKFFLTACLEHSWTRAGVSITQRCRRLNLSREAWGMELLQRAKKREGLKAFQKLQEASTASVLEIYTKEVRRQSCVKLCYSCWGSREIQINARNKISTSSYDNFRSFRVLVSGSLKWQTARSCGKRRSIVRTKCTGSSSRKFATRVGPMQPKLPSRSSAILHADKSVHQLRNKEGVCLCIALLDPDCEPPPRLSRETLLEAM